MERKEKIKLNQGADISENEILEHYPKVLAQLLFDHTTRKNIFWGTDNYQALGNGYAYHDPIAPGLITGERGKIIMPRVKKRQGAPKLASSQYGGSYILSRSN